MFTATVSDLALAWSVLAGAEDAAAVVGRPPRLLRWSADRLGMVTGAMSAGTERAAASLQAAGATVDPFPLEALVVDLIATHATVLKFEIRTERATELAIADQIGERWRTLRDASEATTAVEYESARRTIAAGRAEIAAALTGYDAILGPGALGAAPEGLGVTGDPVMSLAWQALRMPAVAVPGLRDEGNLPLGVQVIGRDELSALRVGVWVEQNLGVTGCR